MTTAVYPGSFRPFHLGHLDVIKTASKMFDKVVVLVSVNSAKEGTAIYSPSLAAIMADIDGAGCPNVTIERLRSEELITDYVRRNKVDYVVRGVRNGEDATQELKYFDSLKLLSRDATWKPAILLAEHKTLSSSLVREVVNHDGWVRHLYNLVPRNTARWITENMWDFPLCMWNFACEEIFGENIDWTACHKTFRDLEQAYENSGKEYHNWTHIKECLVEALAIDDLSKEGGRRAGAEDAMALFFHDIVESEEESANLCYDFIVKNGGKLYAAEGSRLRILSTKDDSPGFCAVRDIDRLVLSRPWNSYLMYINAIKKEFYPKKCSLKDFLVGRVAWIEKTLASNVYRTLYFTSHESDARENLEVELESLRSELDDLTKVA